MDLLVLQHQTKESSLKFFNILFLFLLIPSISFGSIHFSGFTQNIETGSQTQANLSDNKSLTQAAWIDIPSDASGYAQSMEAQPYYNKIFGRGAEPSTDQQFNFGIQDCSYYGGTVGMLCASMGMDLAGAGNYSGLASIRNSTVPLAGKHLIVITWHNVAGTAADFHFYFDNTDQGTVNLAFAPNAYSTSAVIENVSSYFTIGSACGNTCPSEYAYMTISEASVWNKALTSGEVSTLWNGGVSSPCSRIPSTIENASLIAYFPLDDKLSGTVNSSPSQLGSSTQFNVNAVVGTPNWSPDLTCATNVQNKAIGGSVTIAGNTSQNNAVTPP